MTLRTKSRGLQWMVWLFASLFVLAVYVGLSQCLYNTVGWNPFDIRCHRLMLPLFVLFVIVARETRWDGIVRKELVTAKRGGDGARSPSAPPLVEPDAGSVDATVPIASEKKDGNQADAHETNVFASQDRTPSRPPPTPPQPLNSTSSPSGVDLFNQARALLHQPIPDFVFDAEYLSLLGKSAATGYAPALAKLGEYAMRRAAWVEAYYWMTMARRNGMHGLSPTLRAIRQNWARAGFRNEAKNVSELFPPDAGSLGRAFLHLDSGHDAATAREFLKAHHPEFLS